MKHLLEEIRMSITITDPELLAQLRNAADLIELRDPEGNVLGRLALAGLGKLPPGVKSPFTDEERAEMRKERTGRPLKDIIRDLETRG